MHLVLTACLASTSVSGVGLLEAWLAQLSRVRKTISVTSIVKPLFEIERGMCT